jgi:hypothetical protein
MPQDENREELGRGEPECNANVGDPEHQPDDGDGLHPGSHRGGASIQLASPGEVPNRPFGSSPAIG